MKLQIITYIILINLTAANVVYCQCSPAYKKSNTISDGRVMELTQSVSYNPPHIIDASYNYKLTLVFTDSAAGKEKRSLDLNADRAIVQGRYKFSSVWHWDDDDYNLAGKIKILHWAKNKIRLRENITVTTFQGKEIRKFSGIKTFKRK